MSLSLIFVAVLAAVFLLLFILPISVCIADGNETEEKMPASEGDSSNLTGGDGSIAIGEFPVHVYITNNDNERLKVSLFIDSVLMDSKDISSKSDLKIDSYPLEGGSHSFKITWWDEDVKSPFEMEEIKDISAETSVNLYTILNEKPKEFEIIVNLVNENSENLLAFLYADGSFKKSKVVNKEGSAELGKINLEVGIHNLSVRWQDEKTRIEYEKSKKISVKRDEVVIFYAPKGMSFEAKDAYFTPQEINAISSKDIDKKTTAKERKKDENAPENDPEDIIPKDYEKGERNLSKEDALEKDESIPVVDVGKKSEKKADEEKDSSSIKYEIGSSTSRDADRQQDNSSGSRSYSESSRSLTESSQENENRVYIYAALVILAVYLLFR